MARPSLLPPHSPPDLPNMPSADTSLVNYLRNLSLWAKNGLSTKLDGRSALPGILLQANDAPAETTPAVFSIQVKTDGTIVAIPVDLASTRRVV